MMLHVAFGAMAYLWSCTGFASTRRLGNGECRSGGDLSFAGIDLSTDWWYGCMHGFCGGFFAFLHFDSDGR